MSSSKEIEVSVARYDVEAKVVGADLDEEEEGATITLWVATDTADQSEGMRMLSSLLGKKIKIAVDTALRIPVEAQLLRLHEGADKKKPRKKKDS